VSVTLHVGTFKTGTTSLQRCLREHPEHLDEHGLRFPRGLLVRDQHLELHLTLMRGDRMSQTRRQGDDWRDPSWCADVLAQVADDLECHAEAHTILSTEGLWLLRYEEEFAALRHLVGDATVIVYLRERGQFLASLRDEWAKRGIAFAADPESYAYVEADSWLADYDARLAPWREHFTTVRTVDYDQVCAGEGTIVPSFFRGLGIPAPQDARGYWLNERGSPLRRLAGNRALGLRFGDEPEGALV